MTLLVALAMPAFATQYEISLSPHDFVWDDPSVGTKEGSGGWVHVTHGSLRAGIQIPSGATIDYYTCHVRDDSSSHSVLTYLRRTTKAVLFGPATSGISEGVGSAHTTTSGTPGDTQLSDLSLINDVVGNYSYNYHIQYNPTDGCSGNDCRLFGCTIVYDYTY